MHFEDVKCVNTNNDGNDALNVLHNHDDDYNYVHKNEKQNIPLRWLANSLWMPWCNQFVLGTMEWMEMFFLM